MFVVVTTAPHQYRVVKIDVSQSHCVDDEVIPSSELRSLLHRTSVLVSFYRGGHVWLHYSTRLT